MSNLEDFTEIDILKAELEVAVANATAAKLEMYQYATALAKINADAITTYAEIGAAAVKRAEEALRFAHWHERERNATVARIREAARKEGYDRGMSDALKTSAK
jgi:hypothetical protein